jgi:hypothetical protein
LQRTLVVLAIAGVVFATTGCGDDDSSGQPTPTAEAPSSSPTSGTGNGVPPIIDQVTEAVTSGEPARLEALFEYQSIRCVEGTPAGPGGPPLCRGDETNGSPVDVLFYVRCETYYIRMQEMDAQRFIADAVATDSELYAAFEYSEVASEGPSYGSSVRYLLIFSRPEPDPQVGSGTGYAIGISSNGVLGINYGCGSTPQELANDPGIGRVVVEPE